MPFYPLTAYFPPHTVSLVILLGKSLLGGHFSLAIYPENEIVGKIHKITEKGKPTSNHLFHHPFSVVRIQ